MSLLQAAFYARVSSEQQAGAHTIASQVAALHAQAAADGALVLAEDEYLDEGFSGATLIRPALERLRDRTAAGGLDRLYVHSPDRLARKYAYQVLLVDELQRAGVEVVFLNRPLGQTPEDELLLQVQGMVAEYERAKILERGTLRLPLRRQARRGWPGPLRDPGGGGAGGAAGLRLGGPRPAEYRGGLPAAADGRGAHPDRPHHLGPLGGLGDPQEPGLPRRGGLRQDARGAAATAAAGAAPPPAAATPAALGA
jgi:DNA invertase Pin-like site-specific DNA recombinase